MSGEGYSARGTDAPWYRGRSYLTDAERAAFRATTLASQAAKRRALSGLCDHPKHPIYTPRLDPTELMPRLPSNGMSALSLFSGGGGLDVGFDRAGFSHVGSFELLSEAAAVLRRAYPTWEIHGGAEGDVTRVDWAAFRGQVDVLHGGPPCQPFSHAGRQNGSADARDMIPALVNAVRKCRPRAFLCENVAGLGTQRFAEYVQRTIYRPLSGLYRVQSFYLDAADFGVPQRRRRLCFVGFREKYAADAFSAPSATHSRLSDPGTLPVVSDALARTMGAREALGLPDIGSDSLAPTIRSGLTGPRHTTSVLNSVSAQRIWSSLRIWPNGVAVDREHASAYVAKGGHFRLSVPDCLVLQGFPGDWPVGRPVYLALGLIGNAVAPPMAYHLARAVAAALTHASP